MGPPRAHRRRTHGVAGRVCSPPHDACCQSHATSPSVRREIPEPGCAKGGTSSCVEAFMTGARHAIGSMGFLEGECKLQAVRGQSRERWLLPSLALTGCSAQTAVTCPTCKQTTQGLHRWGWSDVKWSGVLPSSRSTLTTTIRSFSRPRIASPCCSRHPLPPGDCTAGRLVSSRGIAQCFARVVQTHTLESFSVRRPGLPPLRVRAVAIRLVGAPIKAQLQEWHPVTGYACRTGWPVALSRSPLRLHSPSRQEPN